METPKKTIVCREAGVDCDFAVRDSDEDEVLHMAQDHAKRKHGEEYSYDQLRPAMRDFREDESHRV